MMESADERPPVQIMMESADGRRKIALPLLYCMAVAACSLTLGCSLLLNSNSEDEDKYDTGKMSKSHKLRVALTSLASPTCHFGFWFT